MRVALYGGSFDPPHLSHQMACLYVLATQPIDEVWMVPCYQHAFGKISLAFEHRYQMCLLSTSLLYPRVKVSPIEAELSGISYTLKTVKTLKDRHPDYQFSLMVGEDTLATQDKWHGIEELKKLVSFILLGREGVTSKRRFPIKLPDVSSTLIRDLLQQGILPEGLVSKEVLAYIKKNHLYQ